MGLFSKKKSASKSSSKKKLDEPIAVKDSLGDSGAKKLKEASAGMKQMACPFCNSEDYVYRNGVYMCCGNRG